jgi:hypothetical protein
MYKKYPIYLSDRSLCLSLYLGKQTYFVEIEYSYRSRDAAEIKSKPIIPFIKCEFSDLQFRENALSNRFALLLHLLLTCYSSQFFFYLSGLEVRPEVLCIHNRLSLISLRIVQLPTPCILTHFFDAFHCNPI